GLLSPALFAKCLSLQAFVGGHRDAALRVADGARPTHHHSLIGALLRTCLAHRRAGDRHPGKPAILVRSSRTTPLLRIHWLHAGSGGWGGPSQWTDREGSGWRCSARS